MNDFKNKKSKDIINKKLNDIVNNTTPFKTDDSIDEEDSVNKNIDMLRKNTKSLMDKINKNDQVDETDFDKLAESIEAKLELGDLKPLRPLRPIDLSISRPPDLPINTKRIKTPINKELEDSVNSLNKSVKKYWSWCKFCYKYQETRNKKCI